jgi:hypothetical protein
MIRPIISLSDTKKAYNLLLVRLENGHVRDGYLLHFTPRKIVESGVAYLKYASRHPEARKTDVRAQGR